MKRFIICLFLILSLISCKIPEKITIFPVNTQEDVIEKTNQVLLSKLNSINETYFEEIKHDHIGYWYESLWFRVVFTFLFIYGTIILLSAFIPTLIYYKFIFFVK